MAWGKKLQRFRQRFTPRQRRIVGGVLFAVWGVGLIVYPSSQWIYVAVLASVIFFSAWQQKSENQ